MFVKGAVAGYSVINHVIGAGFLSLIGPLREAFNQLGLGGNTDVLKLYYYACSQELQRQTHRGLESEFYKSGEVGITSLDCPAEVLDAFGENYGIAYWLYASMLTSPHDSHDWRNWYLSKLIQPQGWTLIFAMNEAEAIPNGIQCPAFALAVRSTAKGSEAVLSIRGSSATMDFCIDMKEDGLDFEYCRGNLPGDVVHGKVHAGMFRGAVAILDDYGIRLSIERLLSHGYSIKVIGHSLGAGTAALIATELKNGFMKRLGNQEIVSIPKIVAYAYACPCVASAEIAAALVSDELVFSLVNRDDPVPRGNRKSIAEFVDRVNEFDNGTYDRWYNQDYKDYKRFVRTCGKKSHMVDTEPTASSETSSALSSETDKRSEKKGKSTWMPRLLTSTLAAISSPLKAKTTYDISSDEDDGDDDDDDVDDSVEGTEKGGGKNSKYAKEKIASKSRWLPNIFTSKKDSVIPPMTPKDRAAWIGTPLVVPGVVVCMYLDSRGRPQASIGDYRMKSLQTFSRLTASVITHHLMGQYLESLRNLRSRRRLSQMLEEPESRTSSVDEPSDSKCNLCEINPTWAFITHSDSTRGVVSYSCSVCLRVCCAICAPAGDSVPGDGPNVYETLQDCRIPLPSMFKMEPQRVCLSCYFTSYEL